MLAGMMERFYYLKPALVASLIFIGAKMLASDVYNIPIEVSLVVIFAILGIALGLSAVKAKTENNRNNRITQYGLVRSILGMVFMYRFIRNCKGINC
jgi:predicted tellurium resistance membrane protein TerC